MNEDEYQEAVAYNTAQLAAGAITPSHVTSMTAAWQETHALEVDGKCGPTTRASIVLVTDEVANPRPPGLPGFEFHDRRKYAAQAHGPGGVWPVTSRPLSQVTGVCLHQTACVLGERPERYDTVGAHIAITRLGKVIWLHSFDRKVMHGNGWNNGTVGIEIDGLYAGVEGDPSTVWDDPSTPVHEKGLTLLPSTITAVRDTIRWIYTQVPGLKVLVAHRQSSGSRRNDPGSAIWKGCALPMHAELGLTDGGVGFKLDNGYPIPEAWDPRCVGIKY